MRGLPRSDQPTVVPAPVGDDAGPAALRVYSTTWCGSCIRLKRQLDREGVPYDEIDIERHEDAAVFVMSVNGGNRTVPTVELPDGSTLSDPPVREVLRRLARLQAAALNAARHRGEQQ
jgi:mycoredoxin